MGKAYKGKYIKGKGISSTDRKQLIGWLRKTIELIREAKEVEYTFNLEAGMNRFPRGKYLISKWDGTKRVTLDLNLRFKEE